jgi:hypothetical protein
MVSIGDSTPAGVSMAIVLVQAIEQHLKSIEHERGRLR